MPTSGFIGRLSGQIWTCGRVSLLTRDKYCDEGVSPVVQLFLILKHPKRLHGITEFLGIVVVYFTGGCKANGRGDAVMFLALLPAQHGAARKQGANSLNDSYDALKTMSPGGNSPVPGSHREHLGIRQSVTEPTLSCNTLNLCSTTLLWDSPLACYQEPLRKHSLANIHTCNNVKVLQQ